MTIVPIIPGLQPRPMPPQSDYVRIGPYAQHQLSLSAFHTSKLIYAQINNTTRKTVAGQGSTNQFLSSSDYGVCDVPDGSDTPVLIPYNTPTMFDSMGAPIEGGPAAGDDTIPMDTTPGNPLNLGRVGFTGRLPFISDVPVGDGLTSTAYGTYVYTNDQTGKVYTPTGTPDKLVRKPKLTVNIANGLEFITATPTQPVPKGQTSGRAIQIKQDNNPPVGQRSGINVTSGGVSASVAPNNPGIATTGPAGDGLQVVPGGSGSSGGPNSGIYAAGRGIQIDGNGPPTVAPTGSAVAGSGVDVGTHLYAIAVLSGFGTVRFSQLGPTLAVSYAAGNQQGSGTIPALDPNTYPTATGVALCRTKAGTGPSLPAGAVPISTCTQVQLVQDQTTGAEYYQWSGTGTGGTSCNLYYDPSLMVTCGSPPLPINPATGTPVTYDPSNCSFNVGGVPFDPTQPADYGLPTQFYVLQQFLGIGGFSWTDTTPDASLTQQLPDPTPPLINNMSFASAAGGITILEDDTDPHAHKLWHSIDLAKTSGANTSGLATDLGDDGNGLGILTQTTNTALGYVGTNPKVLAVQPDNVTIGINPSNKLYAIGGTGGGGGGGGTGNGLALLCAMTSTHDDTYATSWAGYTLPWDMTIIDQGFNHSTTTNPSRIVIPADGIYQIYALVSFQYGDVTWDPAGGAQPSVQIFKNGNYSSSVAQANLDIPWGDETSDLKDPTEGVQVSVLVHAAAGDYLEVHFQETTSAVPVGTAIQVDGQDTLGTSNLVTWVYVVGLGSTGGTATSGGIAVATNSAEQKISQNGGVITMDVMAENSMGATLGTHGIKAPNAGDYLIGATVNYISDAATIAPSSGATWYQYITTLYLMVNGQTVLTKNDFISVNDSVNGTWTLDCQRPITLAQNDEVTAYIWVTLGDNSGIGADLFYTGAQMVQLYLVSQAGGGAGATNPNFGTVTADTMHVTGANTLQIDGRTQIKNLIADPSTPAAGYGNLYTKSVGGVSTPFYQGDDGVVHNLLSGGGGGSGTVTSVGLSMPAEFSVAGSPVTTSGTLAVTKANQSANQVYAGPSSGAAAAPGFRALVAADLPLATTSAFGAVKPDGSTITISGGVISSVGGGGGGSGPAFLGESDVTSNLSTSATSFTDMTGLSVTVTIGTRSVKVRAYLPQVSGTNANALTRVAIVDVTNSNAVVQRAWESVSATPGNGYTVYLESPELSPAAGSRTYKLQWFTDSGNTATMQADPAYPAFISVQEV